MRVSVITALAFACATLVWGCGATQPGLHAGPMPSGGSFTGVWYSPEYGEMHIVQNGATAIGRYAKEEKKGRIQGAVDGDLMRFEWTQERELIVGRPTTTKGHGYFRVRYDESEQAWKLEGEWGHEQSERGGGRWTAIRSRKGQPDVDGDGRPDGFTSEDDYSGTTSYGGSDSTSGGDDLSDL